MFDLKESDLPEKKVKKICTEGYLTQCGNCRLLQGRCVGYEGRCDAMVDSPYKEATDD